MTAAAASRGGSEPPASIAAVERGVQACRRCELWRRATQGVAGEGLRGASVMLVGEQPGDQEDLAGRPFVGPAGAVLDRAMADAGIQRGEAYITNAVKHFKHELRGKRRLHKTPNSGEISACRWWLASEITLVRPRVVIALGATAARAVFGRPVRIMKERGRPTRLDGSVDAVATVHPAYLLRLPDRRAKAEAYRTFVADLIAAARSPAP